MSALTNTYISKGKALTTLLLSIIQLTPVKIQTNLCDSILIITIGSGTIVTVNYLIPRLLTIFFAIFLSSTSAMAAEEDMSFKAVMARAEQGDAAAQSNLGFKYEFGDGVYQDYAEAYKWYRLAADQGDANGQWSLGSFFSFGKGVAQDYAEAYKWYRLAAEQGDASAQEEVGSMYYFEQGVTQSLIKAYAWYSLAAAQDHERGRTNRDILARSLTPDQLSRGQEIATRCFNSDYKDCD